MGDDDVAEERLEFVEIQSAFVVQVLGPAPVTERQEFPEQARWEPTGTQSAFVAQVLLPAPETGVQVEFLHSRC